MVNIAIAIHVALCIRHALILLKDYERTDVGHNLLRTHVLAYGLGGAALALGAFMVIFLVHAHVFLMMPIALPRHTLGCAISPAYYLAFRYNVLVWFTAISLPV